MKKLLLIFMLVLCTNLVNAQDQKESVVKLKNGIEVRGVIVEHTDTSIVIKDSNGDVFFYNANEVSSINGGKLQKKQTSFTAIKSSSKRGVDGKGYGGKIEVYGGFNFWGSAGDSSFTAINGYHFGPSLYLGVGVGIKFYRYKEYYYNEYYTSYYMSYNVCTPIYLYGQYTFMKGRKVRPYISLGIGGNIAFFSHSGFFLEPSFGLSVKLKSSKSLSFAITSQITSQRSLFSSIGFGAKVGFSF